MKIALLSHMHHPIAEPYQGGTEMHTAMLADALVARGHDVTLFAKEGSVTSATMYPLVPKDFEFVRAASPRVRIQQSGFLAEAVHHSIGIIHDSAFDVVVNNSLSSLPFSGMTDLAMLTILHTPPTLTDVTEIVSDPLWRPGEHHRYVTVSETNAAAWRGLIASVGVVRNGIHLERWAPRVSPASNLAVWAARITPEKGLHVAIDAAVGAGFDFEFAGPIAHDEYFAGEIAPRLSSNVRYRGHLSHGALRDFFARGSVFVASPLWAEPFGLSVVEALASGTPVAAFANGALPELVTPDAGALAHGLTASSLAEAITAAAGRDRSGVIRSSGRFSFEAMIDHYEQILRQLVTSRVGGELARP